MKALARQEGRVGVVEYDRAGKDDRESGGGTAVRADLQVAPRVQGQLAAEPNRFARSMKHDLAVPCTEELQQPAVRIHQRNQGQLCGTRRLLANPQVKLERDVLRIAGQRPLGVGQGATIGRGLGA